MTRPAWRRVLACLLAAAASAGTVALAPGASVAADSASTSTPLQVTIATLTPATIPHRGRVTLTGRITNRSSQTWTDLNVYLVTSATPIRSRAGLARAAGTEADAEVGGRRTTPGLYDTVGDLAPGESVPYRLSVKRADLGISGRPGVYWVGVHVLGALDGNRDSVADGRARTFMPLLPAPGTAAAAKVRTRLALLVPLEQPVHRSSTGRLLGLGEWERSLAPDGRLSRLLDLSRRARQPFTWVVDPALLEAVQSIARNNPQLDTSPSDQQADTSGATPAGPTASPGSTGPSPSAGSSPAAGSGDGAVGSAGGGDGGSAAAQATAAGNARSWLAEFRRQVPARTVATVPYGDLDVASVLGGRQRSIYRNAVALSADTISDFGAASATAVVDPPSGYLPPAALRRVDPETPVVLSDAALPDASAAVVTRDARAPVVLTDTAAGAGGPRPSSQYAALAVRQRLVSDAALHALSRDRAQPLVVTMPHDWDPGGAWSGSRLFAGLDQPWLQLDDLPSVVDSAPSSAVGGAPTYPTTERTSQVPSANLLATQALVRAGRLFAEILTDNDSVDDDLARVAMLASSVDARADPDLSRAQADSTTSYVRAQMAKVRIEGPPFVMMSGESGPIQVTLVNGLDQPVTVGLRASTPGSDLTIKKVDPVTLGPGKRTSERLTATSDDIGVHAVTLRTTDAKGVPLGTGTQFSVRTSHVSTVIWVIMAAGGALLLLAIVVRLFRRVRRRKSTPGPLLPQDAPDHPGQRAQA